MAVPRKLVVVPNSTTRELWRIAESGEMDELAAVLPQVDINARNEHGTTALMRAASHGHVQMVHVLLDHGADPNIKRNDNFTALSLAAFFGHGEIVEILMRQGANADVPTRSGTSPHMWARARSFVDVAKCLEKRTIETKKSVSPQPPVSRPAPPATPSPAPPTTPSPVPVVHTLKEPPEIWDLVQEAPRNFDARSAFMTRIGSMKGGFAIPVAALVIVVGLAIGAVWFLKDVTPVPVAAPVSAAAAVSEPIPANPSIPANQSAETTNVVAEPPPAVVDQPVNPAVNTNVTRRRPRLATSRAISDDVRTTPESIEVTAAPPVVATPQLDAKSSTAGETKKPPTPVNSQVISPPKSSQPKAKVIQWP